MCIIELTIKTATAERRTGSNNEVKSVIVFSLKFLKKFVIGIIQKKEELFIT